MGVQTAERGSVADSPQRLGTLLRAEARVPFCTRLLHSPLQPSLKPNTKEINELMNIHTQAIMCAVFGLLPIFAPSASAQFLSGKTMTLKAFYSGTNFFNLQTNAVVNSTPGAVEIDKWGSVIRWDVFDIDANHASIRITSLTNLSFGLSGAFHWQVSFAGAPTLPFTNVTLGSFDTVGFLTADITNSGTATIDLDMRGVQFPASNSFIRIDISTVPVEVQRVTLDVSQVRVCWNSTSTNNYQVQYRSELTTNEWVNLGPAIFGNGTTNCLTDAVADPKRFYQVLKL